MKTILQIFALLIFSACSSPSKNSAPAAIDIDEPIAKAVSTCASSKRFTLVVHGGVGYTANAIQSDVIRKVLAEGHALLKQGFDSEDVVQKVTELFEDSGVFNAGKGGTRTNIGSVELDASIMEGKTLRAGAVASLKDVKNPIRLARAVKDQTKHVFMVGDGASRFADELKHKKVEAAYFTAITFNENRLDKKGSEKTSPSHYGTVGAVALDRCGNLAAATSTGGLYGKKPGRVGDSPVIGAGTYANNKTIALSATGAGEKFIRANVAGRVSNIVQYTNRSVDWAMKETLGVVESIEGTGGIIVVDRRGKSYSLTIKGEPMPGGFVREDGKVVERDLTK